MTLPTARMLSLCRLPRLIARSSIITRCYIFNQHQYQPFSSNAGAGGDDDESDLNAILKDLEQQISKRDLLKGKFRVHLTCSHGEKHPDQCKTPEDQRMMEKTISRKSYREGIVIIRCPCEKLHLIADNLGWFTDEKWNIEDVISEHKSEIEELKLNDKYDIE